MSGLALSLLSIILFSFMGAMVKAAAVTIPSMQIVFIRSVFTLVIVIVFMVKRRYSFRGEQKLLLALRGLFGGLGLMGFFYMLSEIKLGEAGIIFQLIPIFVVTLSWLILKEKLGRLGLFFLMLPVIGAIMVIKPDMASLSFYPALIGTISSFFAACAYILVRILSVRNNTYLIILSFALGASLVSAPSAISFFIWPNIYEWLLLLGIGISSVLAQIALTKAYGREKASLVSMIGYAGIILNILLGYIFWGEVIDTWSWLGAFLIIIACIGLNVRKKLVKN